MKILFIGDVVGEPGRKAVGEWVPVLREEEGVEGIIVNGENAAGGMGLTPRLAKELFRYGADVITLGDHAWDRQEIMDYLQEEERLLRPLNFPEGAPGRGWIILELANGNKIGIINLLGRVFMRYNVECPFRALEKAVKKIKAEGVGNIVVDMHTEATSEKVALGWFIDGQVSAVVGTHTHVQTADERILPKGTAYITDVGMTGAHDSVIGQNKQKIIQRFLTMIPSRFEVAKGDIRLNGVIIDIDEQTGLSRSIKRIQKHSGI